MKNTAALILLFFLALFAYTKLAGPIPFSVTSVTTQKTDTFSVGGEGKATVVPDIAVVNAGVSTQATTVKAAQDQLNKAINAVSDAVKKLDVDAKDIQTTGYNIYPSYDYTGSRQRITGYEASSNLTIKVRDIEKANSVVDAATAAGANQVGGISFDVDDKTKAQNEAREKAVAQAKQKAKDAAKIAGFTLGRIINYSEDFGGTPRPIPLMAKPEGVEGIGIPTQIEPGSSEISVTVTLSFEIR
ncbi:SIMPL domain-containing protein [Candidatus Gottesmanbacteria bacterium]|nr:SIMPL domain-containing protein [Candidatus Gottesmanbacteria bacterium]